MKTRTKPILASLVLSVTTAGLTATAISQELPPDDPAIAASLGVWFRDAENTLDTETGTWADSSGNDRHAVPVGEVNINGPVTYIGPTLGTISGGAFSAEDVASVHFTSDVDDLLIAADLNADAGLTDLTIFVVFNVNFLLANPNLTRPVGIGSLAAVQVNNGNNLNLAGDPSIRKDNGQLGSGTYSGILPSETTFIRTARMSATVIDEWFNTDGTLQSVLSLPGVSYTTSTDDFFLGDLRAGSTSIPGFAATAQADFDIVQTIVYTTALTDEQVAGVNEWLGSHLTGGSGADNGLAFTKIELAPDHLSATLTWRSKPGKDYAVDLTTDLTTAWEEITDGVPSAGAGTTMFTAPTFGGLEPPDPLPGRVFFRVRELAP
jgi:hypothetical protein